MHATLIVLIFLLAANDRYPLKIRIENLLIDFAKWCSKWSKSAESISQVPCFKGFALTVKTILATFKDLSSQYEGFEFATGLCNQ